MAAALGSQHIDQGRELDGQRSGHSSAVSSLPSPTEGQQPFCCQGSRDVKREQSFVPEQAPTATALHQPPRGGGQFGLGGGQRSISDDFGNMSTHLQEVGAGVWLWQLCLKLLFYC